MRQTTFSVTRQYGDMTVTYAGEAEDGSCHSVSIECTDSSKSKVLTASMRKNSCAHLWFADGYLHLCPDQIDLIGTIYKDAQTIMREQERRQYEGKDE